MPKRRARLVPGAGIALTLIIVSLSGKAQSTHPKKQTVPNNRGACAALIAQSPDAGEDGLTERECALMLRVKNLEQTVDSLRDVQARLAALESKLPAGGPAPATPETKVSSTTASVTSESKMSNSAASPVPASSATQTTTSNSLSPATPVAAAPVTADMAQQPVTQAANQRSGQNQPNGDDKTLLPKASDGRPGVFGEFNPGRGFTVAKGEYGERNLSGYMTVRYLNQLPPDQSARDHLGRPIPVEPRNDFQFHRVMLFSQGWLFTPKFQYQTFVRTVQDTNQVAVGGVLFYDFGKYLTLGAGWNAYPGTQSLQGSHPYWQSFDRVMADEFFRPYFSQGVFAQGNLLPTLQYRVMVGNNNSNLDVPAVKLDRDLSAGVALTWLPTTGEFGPRGAFGDYERHQKLATRFNLAYTFSPEDRQTPIGSAPGNTTLRLADSLNVFDTGALANGVAVQKTHYKLVSASAGMKYRGFWRKSGVKCLASG